MKANLPLQCSSEVKVIVSGCWNAMWDSDVTWHVSGYHYRLQPHISCSHQSSFYSSITYPLFCDRAFLHSSCQWLDTTTHPENLPWLQVMGIASSMCQENETISELARNNLYQAAVSVARVLTEVAYEWQLSLKCAWRREGNIAFRLSRFRFWAQATPRWNSALFPRVDSRGHARSQPSGRISIFLSADSILTLKRKLSR